MKSLHFVFCILGAAFAAHATEPIILSADVRQNWPWDSKIRVVYDMLNTEGRGAAIAVSATDGQRPIEITPDALSGELVAYTDGKHYIDIDVGKLKGVEKVAADFAVSLKVAAVTGALDDILYKVLDLTTGESRFLSRGELMSGDFGSVSTNYAWATPDISKIPAQQILIWTEPASNDVYKTSKLVLRRCPAGSFGMGLGLSKSGVQTSITVDFYIGIFEMTQGQCERIKPNLATYYFTNPSCAAVRPAGNVTFDMIRGKTVGRNWPQQGSQAVDEGTYLAALRTLAGDDGWDLPTEAEWEYAERATTGSLYNNGYNDNSNSVAAQWVARNTASAGSPTSESDTTAGTAAVGSLCPNPWGIYDCHGNVWEWTRDRYVAELTGGENPVGGDISCSQTDRTVKGGSYLSGHKNVQSGARGSLAANQSKDPKTTAAGVDAVGWRVMWRSVGE